MKGRKFIATISGAVFFMSSAMGTELDKKTSSEKKPPNGVEFVKILLKNGDYVDKGCDTVVYGATLQDRLAYLIAPEDAGTNVIVSYECIDDRREMRDTLKLMPVWNCRITGQVSRDGGDKKLIKEGVETDDNDMEVPSASITAYINKENLNIVDLLCL